MKEKVRHTESKVRNLIGVLEGVRENEAKTMFEHFPELMKDTNPQIQEAQQI